MTAKLEQEQEYDIMKDDKDHLIIAIKEREGEPSQPKILYDGGPHALLYRNPELTIVLDYIHPGVREMFSEAKEVTLIENNFKKEEVRSYAVPIRCVPKIPLSDNSIDTLPEGQEEQYPDPEQN